MIPQTTDAESITVEKDVGPVILSKGQAAPYAGLLLQTDDAARLAADYITTKTELTVCIRHLNECQTGCLEQIDNALNLDKQHLDELVSELPREPITVEITPWWTWVIVGSAFVSGVALGLLI